MRTLSNEVRQSFEREDLTICRCVEFFLTTGEIYRLTTLDRIVKFKGEDFLPDPGIEISAVRTSQDAGTQNTEIQMFYSEDDAQISERRVRFGLLNDAVVKIYLVDYLTPQFGGIQILTGAVSTVDQPSKTYCVLDVSSVNVGGTSTLVAEVFAKRCRNVFGDDRCKVDVDGLSAPFTVVRTYTDTALFQINGYRDQDTPRPPGPPPRENGELKKLNTLGETDFTVPNAQILKVKIKASGGAGGGGGYLVPSNSAVDRVYTPGNPAPPTFHSYFEKLDGFGTRNRLALLADIAGGGVGVPFQGYDSRLGNNNPNGLGGLFIPAPNGVDGDIISAIRNDAVEVSGLSKGYGAPGTEGGYHSSFGEPARGGSGGAGGYYEATFYLEDPDCPIKAGDFVHISIGSLGRDEPLSRGGLHITWISNTGEPLLPATFDLGSVKWVTGDNAGQIIQIASNTGGLVYLTNAPRLPIKPGDTGLLRPGCSNYADMCENRWNNLVNMQAEPVTPQGVTTAPSPLTDIVTDMTKPAPVPSVDGFGYLTRSGGGG